MLLAAAVAISILAYHQVEAVPQMGWSVSTEDFNDQMQFLANAGYHVVSIASAYDYLKGTRPDLPPNPVVITVDDGFEDAFTTIAPLLQGRAFPWSLYVYPNFISRGTSALRWEQVAELSAQGVDIEGHTMTHPHLMRKSHPEMDDAQYAAWLHAELADSKSLIEQKTHRPVRFLAYPYGDHDAGVEAEAARCGYVVGLLSWAGPNTRNTNLMELRRLPMESDMTLVKFAAGLGAIPIELQEVSPANDAVGTPRTISAVIAHPAELDPASVHIVLLGENARALYDPRSGRLTLTLDKYTRPRQRVIVYGTRVADGRVAATAWRFYTSAEAKAQYDAIMQRLRELPLHHTQTKRD